MFLLMKARRVSFMFISKVWRRLLSHYKVGGKHQTRSFLNFFLFSRICSLATTCCCRKQRNKSDLYRLGNLVQPANKQLVGQDSQGTSWNSPEQIGRHALVKCTNALFFVDHLDCVNDSLVLWWVSRLILKSRPDHLMRICRNTGRHL